MSNNCSELYSALIGPPEADIWMKQSISHVQISTKTQDEEAALTPLIWQSKMYIKYQNWLLCCVQNIIELCSAEPHEADILLL